MTGILQRWNGHRLHGVVCAVAAGLVASLSTQGCDKSPSGPSGTTLTVTVVSPSTGAPDVETFVRIFGTGFEAGTTLTLDGIATPVTFLSSIGLSATFPKHAAGPVDVVVTNPNGQTSRLAGGYRYAVPPPAPPPRPTRVTITGNSSLANIGETTQLTATALYANGTTEDVTATAQWTSLSESVASVSAAGLVTARSLGASTIQVKYPVLQPLYDFLRVSITPPGTFVLSGRVREPGAGSVTGALVRHLATGQSVVTTMEGDYAFAGVHDAHVSVTKDGYEPVEYTAVENDFQDAPLQRIIRLDTGQSTSQIVAPNDMDYLVGPATHCQPCRLIRVTNTTAGTMHIQVTWTAANVQLTIWVNGQAFPGSASLRRAVADIPVGPGEQIVYLGRPAGSAMLPGHTAFTLEATAAAPTEAAQIR